MYSLIRFHFKVDPENLTDDEFCSLWGELEFALKQESKRLSVE